MHQMMQKSQLGNSMKTCFMSMSALVSIEPMNFQGHAHTSNTWCYIAQRTMERIL